jgi:ubiquinone biosynthesis accessory factor UbiJ
MMNRLFLSPLNRALQAYLAMDPDSAQRLKPLQGKVIQIELLPFSFSFYCLFHADRLLLQTDATIPADTHLRGTPLQFLRALFSKDKHEPFFSGDLSITGEAELGQQVTDLFDQLHIDWEDHLARYMGDIPTYYLSRFIHRMHQWRYTTTQSAKQDISDYLHEEVNWFPTAEALQDLFTDIDQLRMAVDRTEARIKHLDTLLEQKKP